jgi:hypothetical protein
LVDEEVIERDRDSDERYEGEEVDTEEVVRASCLVEEEVIERGRDRDSDKR